jgi:flavin reductase (DIM6/NTAB) family NADH-FMN oxidoreductase RutF
MGIATASGHSKGVENSCVEVPARAWQLLAAHSVVMATAWAGRRYGALTLGVQQASNLPPLVCVSTRCGHIIDPILRDARVFAACAIAPSERVLLRRLHDGASLRGIDAFDGVAMERTRSGLPVVASSLVTLECEIVRHIDLEADHQLYVGRVLACHLREVMQAAC